MTHVRMHFQIDRPPLGFETIDVRIAGCDTMQLVSQMSAQCGGFTLNNEILHD